MNTRYEDKNPTPTHTHTCPQPLCWGCTPLPLHNYLVTNSAGDWKGAVAASQ